MKWQPPDEVRFRRRFPTSAIFFLGIASLVAIAGRLERDFIPYVVTLFLLAGAAWAMAPAAFTLRFHPDGIEHRETGVRVPYQEITFLRLTNRALFDFSAGKASEMHIGDASGCWRLGDHAKIPRNELYQFLIERSRLLELPAVLPGQLREVYEREVVDFGPEQVLATSGRGVSEFDVSRSRVLWIIIVAVLLGAVSGWAVDASDGVSTAFGVIAGFFFFIAVIFTLVFRAQRSALLKLRRACGIVISPRGLTMESPVLKGVITWDEVKDVVVVNRAHALMCGLLLKIEGGQFLIGDHYACPVTEIYRRIVGYRSFERT